MKLFWRGANVVPCQILGGAKVGGGGKCRGGAMSGGGKCRGLDFCRYSLPTKSQLSKLSMPLGEPRCSDVHVSCTVH